MAKRTVSQASTVKASPVAIMSIETMQAQAQASAKARIAENAEYQAIKAGLPALLCEAFESNIHAEELAKLEAPMREAAEAQAKAQAAFIKAHGLDNAPAVMLGKALASANPKAAGRRQSATGKHPGALTGTAWAIANVARFIGKPFTEWRKALESETGRMDATNIMRHCQAGAKAHGLTLTYTQSGNIALQVK